jgi:hypothetical protein
MYRFDKVEIKVEDKSGNYQLCFFWDGEYKKLPLESPSFPILRNVTQQSRIKLDEIEQLIQQSKQDNKSKELLGEKLKKLTQQSNQDVKELKWGELQSITDRFDKSTILIIPSPVYKKTRHFDIYIFPTDKSNVIYIRCDDISGLTNTKD